MKFLEEKNKELTQQVGFKDNTIENQKREINQKVEEIGVMKSKLKTAQDETSQLSHKITEMEKDLTQIENSPKILKRIKEQMLIKGFISDKEITDIEKDFFG